MPIIDVLVPQMGEGLQEVLVVEFLKRPGDAVKRDELFYSMETDKATMEVESPEEGVLVEWLASEGDTLPIGAPICRIEVAAAVTRESTPEPAPVADLRAVPPRTRAYAKEKGLSEDQLIQLLATNPKPMPADIDALLAVPGDEATSVDRPLSAQDKIFLHRLKRSAALVVPATAKRYLNWEKVRTFSERQKVALPELAPSSFNCVAWAIARAVAKHPRFRSVLLQEDTIREYAHLNLGIAVARPTGELVLAVVPKADTLSFEEFVRVAKQSIARAREGRDQANEATQLSLTYLGPYEIIDATPVLVAPAVAVLFIGSPVRHEGSEVVTIALTFDHRLVHGVEAAEFLRTIAQNVEKLS